MHDENLIRMANQIGQFFDSMPNRDEALQGIAKHLKNFWDPRMRRAFLEHLDHPHTQEVSEIVREAVRVHRDLIQ